MTALVLLVLASPAALGLDVDIHAGMSLREKSTGDGVGIAMAYGASVGYSLDRALGGLPLRAEILLASDTFGGGRGVNAVDVSSWQGELVALAGLDWVMLHWNEQGLRLQLLAGPGMRLSWVSIRVQDASESAWSTEALGSAVVGVLYDADEVSLGVRSAWSVPQRRLLQAYVTAMWWF